jgi:hypothetical protein
LREGKGREGKNEMEEGCDARGLRRSLSFNARVVEEVNPLEGRARVERVNGSEDRDLEALRR